MDMCRNMKSDEEAVKHFVAVYDDKAWCDALMYVIAERRKKMYEAFQKEFQMGHRTGNMSMHFRPWYVRFFRNVKQLLYVVGAFIAAAVAAICIAVWYLFIPIAIVVVVLHFVMKFW